MVRFENWILNTDHKKVNQCTQARHHILFISISNFLSNPGTITTRSRRIQQVPIFICCFGQQTGAQAIVSKRPTAESWVHPEAYLTTLIFGVFTLCYLSILMYSLFHSTGLPYGVCLLWPAAQKEWQTFFSMSPSAFKIIFLFGLYI